MRDNLSRIIKNALNKFINKEWNSKNFLTEEDIRMRLFTHLERFIDFPNVSINGEIRWYGDDRDRKLKYRSDIVIIDKNDLQVDDGFFRLPSKGYGFNKYFAIIEIKLIRIKNEFSMESIIEKFIKRDLSKLKKIKERTGNDNNKVYVLVFFDKKHKKKGLFYIEDGNRIEEKFLKWEGA